MHFEHIEPDKKYNWLNLTDNGWDNLIPLIEKKTKLSKAKSQERAIFKLFSLGVVTARDEWAYDYDKAQLCSKISHFSNIFNNSIIDWVAAGRPKNLSNFVNREIKWTSELEAEVAKEKSIVLADKCYVRASYRPFVKKWTYFANPITHRPYQNFSIFPNAETPNRTIVFSDPTAQKPFMVMGIDALADLHLVGAAAGTDELPRFRYSVEGDKLDNITDWGLRQFQARYGKDVKISKDDIFAYCYSVLHDPIYRETYVLNLKREFPRLPLYTDFKRWRDWGQALLDLHIGYEAAEPYPLERSDAPDVKARAASLPPLAKLKSDHENGVIILDSETTLFGVPAAAWAYKLGNRCAIDWVLDQYKEKTPKDKTIREKFNTYRFADYKEQVIDLLQRVTTVSVRTQEIVEAMRRLDRKAANKTTRDDESNTDNADDN